jgi:putative MATE family efflux protein
MLDQAKQARLIEGPVGRTLAALTGPMLIGITMMIAFNLVDTFFVSQIGKIELAAMSFTFPVVLLVGSLTQGLSTGASVVISRAIGEGDSRKFRRLTTDSLTLALLITGIASVAGLFTITPVFELLGAEGDVLFISMPKIFEDSRLYSNVILFIHQYMTIWYLGMIVVVVPMIGNSAIRATGDMKTPAMIMVVAVTVNVILDPLLIFGIGQFEGLGIQGAALATVLARGTALVAALRVVHYRERMIDFARPVLGDVLDSWRQILFVGLPAALTQMLTPISQGIITGLVAGYSTEAVAAFGVASRIEVFGLAAVIALAATLMPFVGQNWGAKKMGRIQLAVRYSQQFSLIWGAMLFVVLAVFREPIAGIFSNDPEVISILSTYLIIVPIAYALQNVLFVVSATLNALNKPLHAAGLIVVRLLVLNVPLAIAGSALIGLEGIFAAAPIANVVAGIGAWWWLRHILTAEVPEAAPRPRDPSVQSMRQPADSIGQ